MNVCDYLMEHGVKPSMQRIALMRYLLEHKTHPNVEEMYDALHKEIPTLSRTTIYNTMKLFVENGLAISIGIDEKNARFDGEVRLHGHFFCQKCGELYDIPVSDKLLKPHTEELNGFKIGDVQIYYKGVCKKCRNLN